MSTKEEENERNFFQILVIFIASISSLNCGLLFAWPSPSIPNLISDESPTKITLEEASYFSIIPPISMVISSPIFSMLMNRIGRKNTLLLISVPQFLAFITVGFSDSLYLFYISRIFAGMGDAGIFTALPAYIGEIATPKVRGSWGNTTTISIYVGEFLINFVGTFLSVSMTGFCLSVVPVIFLITFAFMPETPYYLIIKGREAAAVEALKKLRMKDNVQAEFKQLVADVQRQNSEPGTLKDLFTISSNRKALLAAIFVRGAQQYAGIASFLIYSQYLFQQAGGDISYSTSSNVFCATVVILNAVACLTLDRLGRRLAMLISCVGCFVTLASESVFFYLKDYADVDVSPINWYPVLGMLIWTVLFALGLGIVPTLVLSEIFSTSIKGIGFTITNSFFALCICTSTKLFQFLTSNFGLFAPFTLYSLCCLISAIVSYFLIPETRGRTLEEIQQGLKGNKTTTTPDNT